MLRNLQKYIAASFNLLLFSIPLVLFPKTSEIFEFNKMVTTYFLTVAIVSFWLMRIIYEKKIIFRKTLLDIPLLIFLSSQILSTVFSIDPYTSFYGYYSRFHGGLLSSICYLILYWAFVSNLTKEDTHKSIKYIFTSGVIVSVWGIFEHFGHSFSCLIFPEFASFDVSCWVQDVQNRVYASFGQPNWLAAWMAAVIPLTWALTLNFKLQIPNYKQFSIFNFINFLKFQNSKILNYYSLSIIFFITLLFTKSRSGILAFAVSFIVFWGLTFYILRHQLKTILKRFSVTLFFFLLAVILIGTPWTSSVEQIAKPTTYNQQLTTNNAPALETGGGTDSAKIRQIVWQGAFDIWKNYPVFGTGVETFAFAYYQFRPDAHNSVSEWDYLYNKAHNEYLNFAATTGTVGILSYLTLIGFSILQILKSKSNLRIGLLSGFISILITNFFGFSVVPVALLFFLFPAFAAVLDVKRESGVESKLELNLTKKVSFIILVSFAIYFLFSAANYWKTDLIYAKAKNEYLSQNTAKSRELYLDTIKRSPKNALYWNELADATTAVAVAHLEAGDTKTGTELAQSALNETNMALKLSPANVNLKRNASTRFIQLSQLDPNLLTLSTGILKEALKQAPNDPKLFYNLSLSYLRTGNYKQAIEEMNKAIELKPDYEKARYSIALMYIDEKEPEKAKEHLNYILENINPASEPAKKELEELRG